MQPTQNTVTLTDTPTPAPVAVLPVSPALTLRAAARYLVRHGWIQGAYYDASTGSFTPAACVVGAIGCVCYGGPVDAPAQMFDAPGFAEFEAAVTWLDRYLQDRYGMVSYAFNDAKHRTRTGVLVALHGAANAWDDNTLTPTGTSCDTNGGAA